MKVTDKALEPLIHAFLTDMNTYDSERIYESLYVIFKCKQILNNLNDSYFLNLGTYRCSCCHN